MWFLTKLVGGRPAFRLDGRCEMIRRGFMGKYQYRKMQVGGADRYSDRPEKNEYSHIHDALQYACLYARAHELADGGGAGFGPTARDRAFRRTRVSPSAGWT